jgi:hypothetical protein
MTAIVEKDKNANQDASSHHSQHESDPVGIPLSNRVEHQGPQDEIRNECVNGLPEGFVEIRIGILTDVLIPSRLGAFQLDRSCVSEHIVSPPGAEKISRPDIRQKAIGNFPYVD